MAHYADALLASGERIVRVQRQHWFTIVDAAKEAVIGVVAVLVLGFVRINLPADVAAGPIGTLLGLLILVVLVGSLARLVWAYLHWTTDEFVLTNRRVMQVSGILNKRTTDSSLEKINDAVLTQSWIGRIFGFGDLDILTAAESGIERMRMLVDAAGFKKGMLEAKHELELELARGGSPTPALRAPGPMVPVAEPRSDRRPVPDAPPAEGPSAWSNGSGTATAAPDAVTARPPARPAEPAVATPRTMTPDEVTATLARLADLRDRGAITPEEFEAKKRDLLDRL